MTTAIWTAPQLTPRQREIHRFIREALPERVTEKIFEHWDLIRTCIPYQPEKAKVN